MTDSYRTSASTGLPTTVDDGAPAGHPTPVGEPHTAPAPPPAQTQTAPAAPAQDASVAASGDGEQPELFPQQPMSASADPAPHRPAPHHNVLEAIGELVLAWGRLEHTTAQKLATMRQAFGDVRVVGGRSRPTMQKLLAELRALVAMRDRHDKQVLTVIADIDGSLQRTAQFRILIVDGAQSCANDALICHDLKNNPHHITRADIERETAQLDRIRHQIAGL